MTGSFHDASALTRMWCPYNLVAFKVNDPTVKGTTVLEYNVPVILIQLVGMSIVDQNQSGRVVGCNSALTPSDQSFVWHSRTH